MPIGFPATPSGADLRVLRHIFTPREAEAALYLKYKFEPFAVIRERAGAAFAATEELMDLLDSAHRKGGIHAIERDGQRWYCNAPLVVGMYEMQLGRLSPEFIADVGEYLGDPRFGLSYLSSPLPQMRTIPIRKSLQPHHHVSTFDEAGALLRAADEPFVLVECICRKKAGLKGHPCKVTDRAETCLGMGRMGDSFLRSGNGRRISREEALVLIERNQADGLILQPSNAEKPEFLCSCCGCCCGMLDVHRQLPIPIEFWSANYFAAVEAEKCIGCGACLPRCQAGAVRLGLGGRPAIIDLTRCLGCGLCVPTCPTGALSLVKKPVEIRPPATMEALHETIEKDKSGLVSKLKVVFKLLLDMVRTGRITRLR